MLLCLTASHKHASFELLEQLSLAAPAAESSLATADSVIDGAVIISTCNRFEAYLDVDENSVDSAVSAFDAVSRVVQDASGVDPQIFQSNVHVMVGPAAAGHLFSVAAGLESVIVGETEISGQVRRSLESARERGHTTADLERVFQRASQTSRGIKARTRIGGAGRSMVRLALNLAESVITDWRTTEVLMVGTGSYAGATLAALRDRGVSTVRVYSPSGRAQIFAASHGIEAVAEEDYLTRTASADIIVTCTAASAPILDAAMLHRGRAHADARMEGWASVTALPGCPVDHEALASAGPLFHEYPGLSESAGTDRAQLVIDLGLPRNVDPDVARVPGVQLLDLETISLHAPLKELQATSEAHELVNRAVGKFVAVGQEQSLTPAVVTLRSHVFDALDAEIARLRQRSAAKGTTDTADAEAALRHLAGVLLHTPSVRARELARNGEQDRYVDALDALYGLSVDEPVSGTASSDSGVNDDRVEGTRA